MQDARHPRRASAEGVHVARLQDYAPRFKLVGHTAVGLEPRPLVIGQVVKGAAEHPPSGLVHGQLDFAADREFQHPRNGDTQGLEVDTLPIAGVGHACPRQEPPRAVPMRPAWL